MIQFNLLPSVKIEYIKTQRVKRLVIGAAAGVSALSLIVFLIMFLDVHVIQKRHINNLTNEINENVKELQAINDIDKVLTVQNQLNSLTPLHEQKPATGRFQTYLTQITPEPVSITSAHVSFSESKIIIAGSADSLATVNKFVDTVKFTKYTADDGGEQNAFSDVVLSSFSVDEKEASFEITFKFNPEIFNNTKQIKLTIPSIITTRSQTERPTNNLFQKPPDKKEEQ